MGHIAKTIKEKPMETYILRIYRHSADQPEQVTGISEHVETGEKQRFENFQQLNEIIIDSVLKPEQRKKKLCP